MNGIHPPILAASVKVMRSHDYCHFEVQLSTTEAATTEQIDALRKAAARLVDKAVEQYKIAKLICEERGHVRGNSWEKQAVEEIRKQPEQERTPGDHARLKDWDDRVHRANRGYDYEDDWEG